MKENNITKKVFDIEGMSCASCANNVEKKLKSLSGIKEVNVNIANDKAIVSYDSKILDESAIMKAVEDSGYKAILEEDDNVGTKIFDIEGMTCANCALTIDKKLHNLKGVKDANVSIANNKAKVTYDFNALTEKDIIKAVKDSGYSASLASLEVEEEEISKDEIKMQKSKRLMYISIFFSSIIMSLMMIDMFVFEIPFYIPITAILGFPIVFGTGLHVHKASLRALKGKSLNMDILVTLGSVPPYLIGLLGLLFTMQTFIEMATTIMTFHLIGKYLEDRAKGKASQAIKKLLSMGAKSAHVLVDGKEIEKSVKDLNIDDLMIIRPGEKIPTDGVIIEGASTIDESMATGESMPVKRGVDDEVIGATINKQGLLKVKVTKVGKDTFLSQIIKLVEECQGSKVPIQEFADKVTGYFVPAIIIITFLTFISFNLFPDFHMTIINWGATFLPWVNPDLSPFTLSFITATAVLVVSCPCALGLGTPTALMVGSGVGASKGILIRNGAAIQTMKDISVIAFDKTGTITKGSPEVTDWIDLNDSEKNDVLYYTATLENASEHPLSHAIVSHAKQLDISFGKLDDFNSLTGSGVTGKVDGKEVLIGNRKAMSDSNIDISLYEDRIQKLENEAKTAMIVAISLTPVAIIGVSDPIKDDSIEAIKKLEAMGIKTAMITGDNERTANAIGKIAGISHIISQVLPEGKVNEIRKLQEEFGLVAMVGDGINDAPALKQANVGIALGTGTDVAIEAGDVTLVRGELTGIVSTIKLSRAIFRKIKENYFWAWVYNAVAIPVAMFGLLHPMIGAAAMALSSLNVVYNSLRLKKVDLEK